MWILFHVPCPTPDGRTARDLYEHRVERIDDVMRASSEEHGCTFHRAWYTPDQSAFYALAHWRTREGAHRFFEQWEIDDEPGEEAIVLEGDIGLVALGGDTGNPASQP